VRDSNPFVLIAATCIVTSGEFTWHQSLKASLSGVSGTAFLRCGRRGGKPDVSKIVQGSQRMDDWLRGDRAFDRSAAFQALHAVLILQLASSLHSIFGTGQRDLVPL